MQHQSKTLIFAAIASLLIAATASAGEGGERIRVDNSTPGPRPIGVPPEVEAMTACKPGELEKVTLLQSRIKDATQWLCANRSIKDWQYRDDTETFGKAAGAVAWIMKQHKTTKLALTISSTAIEYGFVINDILYEWNDGRLVEAEADYAARAQPARCIVPFSYGCRSFDP